MWDSRGSYQRQWAAVCITGIRTICQKLFIQSRNKQSSISTSNGQAERMVQTVKRLLKVSEEPEMALLTYRGTPFAWCGLSPSELLMGRRLRTNIPINTDQLIQEWKFLGAFRVNNQKFKEDQKHTFDCHHGVRRLSSLPPESDVWISSGDNPEPGTVIAPAETPRSYTVETASGQRFRRNRQHLNVLQSSEPSRSPTEQEPRDTIMTRSKTGTVIRPFPSYCSHLYRNCYLLE